MYSTQPNGAEGATFNPQTINPAALNPAELLNPSSRGLKRSRSPESYQEPPTVGAVDDGDSKPRKRGRPTKPRTSGGLENPEQSAMPTMPQPQQQQQHQPQQSLPPQTPQTQNASLRPNPGANFSTPAQASPPPKTTPGKTTLKALPTVRDHTTDQLGPGGDEYLPREIDDAGEKKVMPNGQLLGGREYRCRTFLVPNRGDKLFMLATECARVLGYRDSYLLFNKNRSLFKIIANQVEKDDLVNQEILPFSYRSRQIAIVTARSMFRQFGSRVIQGGRRVRDDYWETKARKQGFTEADMAGEKRPGAAKARAEAEANNAAAAAAVGGPHGEIVYANPPTQFGATPQPQLVTPDLNDTRTRDYSNFIKGGPRQEINGPAYQDRTQPAPLSEIHAQAHHAAEFNRTVNQQRDMRSDYLQGIWRRPHEQPTSSPQPVNASDNALPTTRASQPSHTGATTMQPSTMLPNQSPQMMMTQAPYSQPIHAQQQLPQASLRGMPQPSAQKQSRPPSISSATPGNLPQGTQPYNYGAQNQMWSHSPTPQTPQHYQGYTTQQTQASPHPQHSPAPQMRHPGNNPQMQPGAMQYPGMQGLGQGYQAAGQTMYPPEQTPRQFMPQNPQGGPSVTQTWSNPQTTAAGNWWANQPQ